MIGGCAAGRGPLHFGAAVISGLSPRKGLNGVPRIHHPNPFNPGAQMKTFDEAMDNAERVLTAAENQADKADPERARELVSVAHAWMMFADRIQDRERNR